ncbi:MAG: hypothetical protein V4612_06245 [Pseudomonadota bacterium]
MPYFTDPISKKEIEIPPTISFSANSDPKILTFLEPKTKGGAVGGVYQGENNKKYIIKFSADSPYSGPYKETLFNDLARICFGSDSVAEETLIGYGRFGDNQNVPCIISSIIPDYKDIANFGENTPEGVGKKKIHAQKFHSFYVWCALVGYDDLNEGNFGLCGEGKTPALIDWGFHPNFLHSEQRDHQSIVFNLVSLVSHYAPAMMQLVRRRYFGYDQLLNPLDKSDPEKPQEISYYSILAGVKNIIDKQDAIFEEIQKLQERLKDEPIPDEQKEELGKFLNNFQMMLQERIDWMQANFFSDIKLMGEKRQEFTDLKWRKTPKFRELVEQESVSSKQYAAKAYQQNLEDLCAVVGCKNEQELLDKTLDEEEKLKLKNFINDRDKSLDKKFVLHHAVMNNDVGMVKWLFDNDLANINQIYSSRKHNYHNFRLTPLNMAIGIACDKMVYSPDKNSYEEMIDVLRGEFFKKNGQNFNKDAKYDGDQLSIELTFLGNYRYKLARSEIENQAATIIKKAVKQKLQENTKQL